MAENSLCKYKSVAESLLRRIDSGELTGTLPGVKQLALEYDINFMTVDRAIRELEKQAVVHRVSRKGTFIRKHKNIALCAIDPNPQFIELTFYAPFANAAQNYLVQQNYFTFSENMYGRTEEYLENLSRKIDGLILFSGIIRKIPEVFDKAVKIMAMGVVEPECGFDHVTYDTAEIGRIAVDYLMDNNCKRLVYIGARESSRTFSERQRSFIHHAEINKLEYTIVPKSISPDNGDLKKLLDGFKAMKKRPDGIFCSTDAEAVFVSNWLWTQGIIPGKDVFIIGCNNERNIMNMAMAQKPATIDLRLPDIGVAAAELLCRRIDGYKGKKEIIRLKPELIIN